MSESDRAGWFGFWIAILSAERGGDPRRPVKCFQWIGVLLERVEDLYFGGREGEPVFSPGPSIARLDKLHDRAGGGGGNRNGLDQTLGLFQMTLLQLESLLVQGTEELLNMAALPIPAMCRMLAVHASGFYAWLREPFCQCAFEDQRQTALLKKAWDNVARFIGIESGMMIYAPPMVALHKPLLDKGPQRRHLPQKGLTLGTVCRHKGPDWL